MSLQGTSWPLGFSVGVLFDPISALLAWYLLLSYPAVRLTRAATVVFAFAVATVVVGFVPWFFLSTDVAGATPLARCTADCPMNALMIADRPDAATHFGTTEEICRMLFALALVALIVSRLVFATRSSPPHPRSGLCGRLRLDRRVRSFRRSPLPRRHRAAGVDTLGWFLTGARVALPLGFVLALLLAQTFAGRSLATMMLRLQAQPTPAALERAAAEALGDPRLRLALRQPEQDGLDGRRGGADRACRRRAGPSLARARQRRAADDGARL